MQDKLRVAADAATVIVAVVVIAVVADRYFAREFPDTNPLTTSLLNTQIDAASMGVDFTVADRTAIVFVQQECPACAESLPFYRRLTDRDTEAVQILFAAPQHNAGIASYLASNAIAPDRVLLVRPGQLPAMATPTVMVVDRDGSITHSWVGWLSTAAENEVLNALFGT